MWSSAFVILFINDRLLRASAAKAGRLPTFSFPTTSLVGRNTEVSKKLEACVFHMFHYALAWHPNSGIMLSHVCSAFHSHTTNKCYDVQSNKPILTKQIKHPDQNARCYLCDDNIKLYV